MKCQDCGVEDSLETEAEQRARPKSKDQGTRAEPAERRAKVKPTVQKMPNAKQKTTKAELESTTAEQETTMAEQGELETTMVKPAELVARAELAEQVTRAKLETTTPD